MKINKSLTRLTSLNKVYTHTHELDHLYEPVLCNTCVRREITYKWFIYHGYKWFISMVYIWHHNFRSLVFKPCLFVFVVVALFFFGGLHFDLPLGFMHAYFSLFV